MARVSGESVASELSSGGFDEAASAKDGEDFGGVGGGHSLHLADFGDGEACSRAHFGDGDEASEAVLFLG